MPLLVMRAGATRSSPQSPSHCTTKPGASIAPGFLFDSGLAFGAAAVIGGKNLQADERDLEGAQELYGLMLGVIGERRRIMRSEGLLVPVEVSVVMDGDNALTTRDSYPSPMSDEVSIDAHYGSLVASWKV